MPTQQDQLIPLHHAPDDRGYRLIELPMEIESLLLSDNPPVMTLESTDTAAILKTPDRSYSLRQKNTSNALILIAPHTPAAPSAGSEKGAEAGAPLSSSPPQSSSQLEEPGIAAFATIKETVELDPVREPAISTRTKHTGSRGKWHEMFGRGR